MVLSHGGPPGDNVCPGLSARLVCLGVRVQQMEDMGLPWELRHGALKFLQRINFLKRRG